MQRFHDPQEVTFRLSRQGISLFEVVVVAFILALLLGLLIPAVQSAREASRRLQCVSNMRELALATLNHHERHGAFPPEEFDGREPGIRLSVHVAVLPELDQTSLYEGLLSIPQRYSTTFESTDALASKRPQIYGCPSDPVASSPMVVSYGPNRGWVRSDGPASSLEYASGVLIGRRIGRQLHRVVRMRDIIDGTSHTALYDEMLPTGVGRTESGRNVYWPQVDENGFWLFDLSPEERRQACLAEPRGAFFIHGMFWVRPYQSFVDHVTRPGEKKCEDALSAGSLHAGMVNVAFVDGHVRSIERGIDLAVWRAIGSRDGGEAVSTF